MFLDMENIHPPGNRAFLAVFVNGPRFSSAGNRVRMRTPDFSGTTPPGDAGPQ